jgi:hypothetical protein
MECLQGNMGSCEQACEKGIGGQDGCLKAAQGHRGDNAPEQRAKALAWFERGCELGEADACAEAAGMIPSAGSASPPNPHREELVRRGVELHSKRCHEGSMPHCVRAIELLADPDPGANRDRKAPLHAKACDLGNGDACDQAWRVYLAEDQEKARSVAMRFCENTRTAEADRQACKTKLGDKIRSLDDARQKCARGDAEGCADVGDGLAMLDPERAKRAYEQACKLRGFDADALWKGYRADIRDARGTTIRTVSAADGALVSCAASYFETTLMRGKSVPETIDPKTWTQRPGGFGGFGHSGPTPEPILEMQQPTVEVGARTPESTAKAAEALTGVWKECYHAGLRHNPNLQGRVEIRMLADARGRAHIVNIANTTLPDSGVIHCMTAKLEGLRLDPGPVSRLVLAVEARPAASR